MAWTQAPSAQPPALSSGAGGRRGCGVNEVQAGAHPAEIDKRTAFQPVPTITISCLQYKYANSLGLNFNTLCRDHSSL